MKSQSKFGQSKNQFVFKPFAFLVMVVLMGFTPEFLQAQLFEMSSVTLGTTNKGLPGGEFAFVQDAGEDFPMVAIAGHNVTKGFVRVYSQQFLNFHVVQDLGLSLRDARLAWGDIDGDGDSDLLVTGSVYGKDLPVSLLYRNDNGSEFVRIQRLKGVSGGSAAFGDIDQDGDQDILLTGKGIAGDATLLYRNQGDGYYAEMSHGLMGISQGSASLADLDGDGDLDIVLAGKSDRVKDAVMQIYQNDEGAFLPMEMKAEGLAFPTIAFGDYDGDGDADILMTGRKGADAETVLLENEGHLSFVKVESGLAQVAHGNASFGDVDQDGDQDILLTGKNSAGEHMVQIYLNDEGTFEPVEFGDDVSAHFAGTSALVDTNADGDLDVVFVKDSPDYPRLATLMNNSGYSEGTFGMK
ncbi:MAG: VCBS repeat-containing protein [Bacteroidia bacterium]|nr:VCBS repeat-containing protein [Bacteroidia bacterium]